MHEANYSDKWSFKFCFLHKCTALISVIAVFVLWSPGRRSRSKIVSSIIVWPHCTTISPSNRNSCKKSVACLSKQFIRFMPSSTPLLTFQRLGLVRANLVPNSDLGLDKSPNQTNTKFSFMAFFVLYTLLLRFIHSDTFKSSLSSANQFPKAMTVQLSLQKEVTRLGIFQRSKRQ